MAFGGYPFEKLRVAWERRWWQGMRLLMEWMVKE
jgi:hypothetical protein